MGSWTICYDTYDDYERCPITPVVVELAEASETEAIVEAKLKWSKIVGRADSSEIRRGYPRNAKLCYQVDNVFPPNLPYLG